VAPAAAQCQIQKLLASDGTTGDWYGYSAAVSGNLVVVGQRFDDDLGPDSGSAYVYELVSGVWTQTAKLLASDGASLDGYGRSVAVSGNTVMVSARYHDDNFPNSGAGYFYEKVGGVWTEVQKVTASDPQQAAWMGHHVDMNGDLAIFGAPKFDGVATDSGAAYVFERSGPGQPWLEVAKLTASDGAAGDDFGYAVGIDGDTAIVAAWNDDEVVNNSGSVYVFQRAGVGSPFVETARLNHTLPVAEDHFGSMVSISGDTVLVGAIGADQKVGASIIPDTGAAWIFERPSPLMPFQQRRRLTADVPTNRDFFGFYVDVDADNLIVGSWGDDDQGSDSGSAYVYSRTAPGQPWLMQPKISVPEGDVLDEFGVCVSISGDLALITAGFDDDLGVDSGSAYLFSVSGTNCATLSATPYDLSLAAGGAQVMSLTAGAAFANGAYWLAGTASGTWPGIPFGGFLIPLNPDPYFLMTVATPGTGTFTNNLGVLDASGAATVTFTLPAASDPSLAGLGLDHAFVVYDPFTAALQHVSNSTRLLLGP
jgi:hypothetical protein